MKNRSKLYMYVLALKYGLKTTLKHPESAYMAEWAEYHSCKKTTIKCL